MIKVLFLCIHNSARSQMAEAFLNKYGYPYFTSESAGIEAGQLNPLVVEAMDELDIDISKNITKSVFDLHSQNKSFDYVVTVCDQANADKCPIFPGVHKKINWSFDDPSQFEGTASERLIKIRIVRDGILLAVKNLITELGQLEKG